VEVLSIVPIGDEFTQVALVLLAVQGACAALILLAALRAPTPPNVPPRVARGTPQADELACSVPQQAVSRRSSDLPAGAPAGSSVES
jgi:hypothetical protein